MYLVISSSLVSPVTPSKCLNCPVYTVADKSTILTPKVEVADTVGAGDSFSGAFVYSILAGKSLHEAHQTAVGTAAFVCTKEGAWPAYPI